jgi:hypothetical protein
MPCRRMHEPLQPYFDVMDGRFRERRTRNRNILTVDTRVNRELTSSDANLPLWERMPL